ncbi:MAG: hypothetical protein WBV67_01485, partial [Candidatus Cybelea sp.]
MVFKSVKPSSPGMKVTARLALLVISAAVYLGLAVLGIGGLAAFLSHSALIALAATFFALSIAAVFAGGNVSPGVREDRRNRWVVVAVVAIGLVS